MIRRWSAVIVVVLGLVVVGGGCATAWNYGVVADETGISGANPLLWVVILAGVGVVITALVQLNQSAHRD